MKLIDLYKTADSTVFSIEILPPRNGRDENIAIDVVRELKKYDPGFVSITMGSDLSLRGGSLALAYLIKSTSGIEVLAHCTCVNRSQEEIENLLNECRYLGLENILSLRGDPPMGEKQFAPHPRGHKYASEMASQITKMNRGMYLVRPTDKEYDKKTGAGYFRKGIPTQFCIGVAGHPDGHPDCSTYEKNFLHLKEKQDAGAQFIITQAFFHIDVFKRFIEKADMAGITIPIIPGIMPLMNYRNLTMATDLFKATVPKKFIECCEKNKNNPDEFQKAGIDQAVSLCAQLLDLKVKGIQFFTLNRKGVVPKILKNIP